MTELERKGSNPIPVGIGMVLGLVASNFLGASFFVPLMVALVPAALLWRFKRFTEAMSFAVGMSLGRILMGALSYFVVPELISAMAIDLAVELAIGLWLMFFPSRTALAILIVLQLVQCVLIFGSAQQVVADFQQVQLNQLYANGLIRLLQVVAAGIAMYKGMFRTNKISETFE